MGGGEAYTNLADAFLDNIIDVVVIAVPDEYHGYYVEEVAKFLPKCIIVEKPISLELKEAKKIYEKYKNSQISFIINYSRRFIPEFIKIKEEISRGDFGDFVGGHGIYGKGILHNGSHMIDLVRFLLGDIQEVMVYNHEYDYKPYDPSVHGNLKVLHDKLIHLTVANANYYTTFELDLLFSKGRIRILNGGLEIEVYEVRESEIYKGYRNLFLKDKYPTQLNMAFRHMAESIYRQLTFGEVAKCGLYDGYEAVRVCSMMKKMVEE